MAAATRTRTASQPPPVVDSSRPGDSFATSDPEDTPERMRVQSAAAARRILGINGQVDKAELKAAFQRSAKMTHPDVTGGDGSRFKTVQEAYDLLSRVTPGGRDATSRREGVRRRPQDEAKQRFTAEQQARQLPSPRSPHNGCPTILISSIHICTSLPPPPPPAHSLLPKAPTGPSLTSSLSRPSD